MDQSPGPAIRELLQAADSSSTANGRLLEACVHAMRRLRQASTNAHSVSGDRPPISLSPTVERLLRRDDALGWVYQALNAPSLQSAYRATARDRRKFTPEEIPRVTQLFTPRWVVEFLLHNTLGRLWLDMHPGSRLKEQLRWLVVDSSRCLPAPSNASGLGDPCGTAALGCGRREVDIPCPPAGGPQPRAASPHGPFSIPPPEYQGSELGPKSVSGIRILDPACGTMNFGLVAAELLAAMYREEADRAGEPGWPTTSPARDDRQIGEAILRDNLVGIDIDPVALQLARHSLHLKLGLDVAGALDPLRRADALFDRTIAGEFDRRFHVVVTNPPYLSARNLPAQMVRRMKRRFPAAWRDQYACFIQRCLNFAAPGGRVGMLTMQSFMFTGAFERFRKELDERAATEAVAHFGGGLFDVGNPGTLQTAAFILRRNDESAAREGRSFFVFRAVEESDECSKRSALAAQLESVRTGASDGRVHRVCQPELQAMPRGAWAYWTPAPVRAAFARLPRLADHSPPRQGLATTDNARFVRFWWEVEPISAEPAARATPGRWFPYAKGGRFRRWYEAPRHRVDWEDDGRRIKQSIADRYPYLNGKWEWVAKNASYYGRPGGVCWSYLTSGRFSARRLEAGSIFDVAASSVFAEDPLGLLALLNSSTVAQLLAAINPTVNFQVGDLAELPVPRTLPPELGELAARAIELQRTLDSFDETTTDFVAPAGWEDGPERILEIHRKLIDVKRAVDEVAGELYGIESEPALEPIPTEDGIRTELARRWASFAIGMLLGRWGGTMIEEPFQIGSGGDQAGCRVRAMLKGLVGGTTAAQIESSLGRLERFLLREFFTWHVKLYHRRPAYLALGSRDMFHLIAHDVAASENVGSILKQLEERVPPDWERRVDDGVLVNFAPLWRWIPEPMFRNALREVDRELQSERFTWARA